MKKWLWGAVLVAAASASGALLLLRSKPHAAAISPPAEAPAAAARAVVPLEIAESIYDGKLAAGWQDWGWGPHQLGSGPAKIRFSDYGGIILHHAALEPHYAALVFRYQPLSDWPEFLSVSLKGRDATFPPIDVGRRHTAELPDRWREVLIPFSELNPDNATFDRVVLTARVPVSAGFGLLDGIALTKQSAAAPTLSRAADLQILCSAPTHPISELIYGGTMEVWDAAQGAQRIGGNPITRLNWDIDAWNVGSDWFFENGKAPALRDWLTRAREHGSPSALVVPTIGWVAKDSTSVGFPRSKFKEQRKFDPNRAEAGDGFRSDGSPIKPGDPAETSVAAPPETIGRWVRELRDRDRALNTRSVGMYILDNEPSLWDVTHRDVHPNPITYDELLERTIAYGSEIRRADPDATIAGPAEWGWAGYFSSAKDRDTGTARPDRRAHGDTPLVPWYLKSLADHDKKTGIKILDVLDVHFYPAADGLYGTDARTDAAAAALRIRSTRALWDPAYSDESWIAEPIRLIPRLKEWVAANYPGLKISLGEWSFGAEEHISGGLATAEALGRFGQQGLDAAYYWGGPKAGTPAFWAFRAYRNFDGAGGRFQDISLATREQENLSLFASRDARGSRIVAVLVNRDPALARRAQIKLTGCARATSYRVFSFSAGSTSLEQSPGAGISDSGVTESVAPYSLSVLDIRLAQAGAPTP